MVAAAVAAALDRAQQDQIPVEWAVLAAAALAERILLH
jgi:hypothetical protein